MLNRFCKFQKVNVQQDARCFVFFFFFFSFFSVVLFFEI